MKTATVLLATALITVSGCTEPQVKHSPYAGEEARQIKSLSDQEIEDLAEGRGMGFAKVAELNGIPGPKHVLELAEELALTADQQRETQALFNEMQVAAKKLGAELLDVEKELDDMFVHSMRLDSTTARASMDRAALLRASIRWTHVEAHLRQSNILTQDQIEQYAALRGYGDGAGHDHHGSHAS